MTADDNLGENATFFAEAGRASGEELAEQVSRAHDDPLVQVILEAVDGYLLILNQKRQILAANPEVLKALQRDDPSSLVGLRPGEALNCQHFTEGPDGCGTAMQCESCGAALALLASQQSGTTSTSECRMSALVGDELVAKDLRVRCTPLKLAEHQLTAFVLQDISAEKRREVLERTFLHDLMNSLSGMEGWGALLKQADPELAAKEILSITETLKETVLSQRALWQAEHGELAAAKETWPAQTILDRLSSQFSGYSRRQRRHLQVDPAPANAMVQTDRTLLLRVLTNMVKNALEATGPGGTVRAWCEQRTEGMAFVVHNPGAISEEVRPHVFERSFSTKAEKGRGIGTYSMKLFGERYLGGTVSFSTDEVQGTAFAIVLPADGARPAASAVSPTATRAGRLLLAEDDEPVRRLATLFLNRLGFAVTACANGEDAEQTFRDFPGEFDLVLTDSRMPRKGGVDLARNLLALRPGLPILLCSGAATDERTEKAVREGIFVGVISKPFTMRSIAEALERAGPAFLRATRR